MPQRGVRTVPEDDPNERINIVLNKSTIERLRKFCQEEERTVKWATTKALDKFLTEKGY